MDCLAYRQNLLAAAGRIAARLDHAGAPAALPPDAIALPPQTQDGIGLSLWLAPTGDLVAMARFECPPADAAVLEVFCRTVEGLSLEEAAAYGADYTLTILSRAESRPADSGIVSAAHALPVLASAQATLRFLRALRRNRAGMPSIDNARFLAVPSAWRDLPPETRLQRIRDVLADHLKASGGASDLLALERLEDDIRGRPVRVILTHAKSADNAGLPSLMRAIELRLRRDVAPWLEVYAEERVDRNALRRTILVDQRKP